MAPDRIDTAGALARVWDRLQVWTRAAEAWGKVAEISEDVAEPKAAQADALARARCPRRALQAWNVVLQNVPEHTEALRGRLNAHVVMGRHAEALSLAKDLLKHLPASASLLAIKANALSGLGLFGRAVTVWNELPIEHPLLSEGRAAQARRSRDNAIKDANDGALPPTIAISALPPWPEEAQEHWEWGWALLEDQRLDEATQAFQQCTSVAPRWVNAHRALARCYEQQGQWLAAIQSWQHQLSMSPNDVDAQIGRAEAERMRGNLTQAAALYQARLGIRPHDAFAVRGLGAVSILQGMPLKAKAHFERALEIEPGNAFARSGLEALAASQPPAKGSWRDLQSTAVNDRATQWLYLARQEAAQGNLKPARQLLERAAVGAPHLTETWKLLGRVAMQLRDYEGALSAYGQWLRYDPLNADGRAHRSQALRMVGQVQQATDAANAILKTAPEHRGALAALALALRDTQKFEAAITVFEKARKHVSSDISLLCGHAHVLTQLDRQGEAEALWLQVLQAAPNHPYASLHGSKTKSTPVSTSLMRRRFVRRTKPTDRPNRTNASQELERGRAYYKDRSFDSAAKCFERALEIDPAYAEAALRLGMSYEDARRYSQAVDAYQLCLTIDPTHYQAATNIGEALRKNDRYDEAITAYGRALALKPDYLYALAGRAECMRMLGDYTESLFWFDKALLVGRRHAFAVQGKAAALNAMHHYSEAIVLWEKALEIEPTSAFAREGRLHCQARLTSDEGPPEEVDAPTPTPTLDEQGRDLTALARAGDLPNIVGRKQEIRAVMKTLVRRLKANPLLLGDPGVGKTAVIEGVARALVSNDAPSRLKDLRIIELSMGSLVAGTKYRGTFEERLKEIIAEAKSTPEIVLFIDEIHTLVGAGRTEGGSLDAANILKPALARGEITVIGATTMAEYRKHFEVDSALERRFQPIEIKEPTEDDCLHLLAKVAPSYAKHHDVRVEPSALRACVRMSTRFVPERRLPDKALDLLDEACAEASLSSYEVVTTRTVAQVVSDKTGVPVHHLASEERVRLTNIEQTLGVRVKGQAHAIKALAGAVQLARSGLRNPNRPRGVFLFNGSSGVGKTELAKALADFLFPEGEALIKLDMSEYSDRFMGSRLLGAPPGYTGHGEEGQLSGPLRRRPYSVVLLDEFEKAHTDVQAMFLSLFDEGIVTDSEGRKVHARETFFILTSNAGSERSGKGRMGFGGHTADAVRQEVMGAVRRVFRPELLNRIDEVIIFEPLVSDQLEEIAALNLANLATRALEAGIEFTWEPEVEALCSQANTEDNFGARPTLRAIDSLVAEPLGKLLLKGGSAGKAVHAGVKMGVVVFEEIAGRQVQGAQVEQV
ncbi:MAG: tetratricopeptide repeat protein [Rhodobacterales bacterium]|nr:tetratricopeptide repeat protein [Rhodobacterales bacterium]